MNHTRFSLWLLLSSLAMVVGGCSSKATSTIEIQSEPSSVSIVPEEKTTQEQEDRMLAAKDALFAKLSGRLTEVMGSNGPVAAIKVCQQEAEKIATEVSTAQGLQMGRTGVRLRNQNNIAPDWASSLMKSNMDSPTFVKLSNGHSAALLPIKLQSQCLMCHGPNDQIAPAIQDQLTKLYPNDEATGFKEGELRGWFWIDLPNG